MGAASSWQPSPCCWRRADQQRRDGTLADECASTQQLLCSSMPCFMIDVLTGMHAFIVASLLEIVETEKCPLKCRSRGRHNCVTNSYLDLRPTIYSPWYTTVIMSPDNSSQALPSGLIQSDANLNVLVPIKVPHKTCAIAR